MRRMRWVVGLIAVTCLSVPAMADTVDDVLKKLDDSFAKLKSFSMKIRMEYAAEGTRSDSDSVVEFLRKDGKDLSRSESETKTEIKMQGFESKTTSKTLSITDGQFTWSLIEHTEGPQKGTKQVVKSAYESQSSKPSSLKDRGVAKLLPDEKVDGADCYVIEVSMKEAPNAKTTYYYRKSDAIAAKIVTIVDGKPGGTLTSSNIKINPDLSADRFVFKAPEGVEVQDMTKGGAPGAPTPATPDKP